MAAVTVYAVTKEALNTIPLRQDQLPVTALFYANRRGRKTALSVNQADHDCAARIIAELDVEVAGFIDTLLRGARRHGYAPGDRRRGPGRNERMDVRKPAVYASPPRRGRGWWNDFGFPSSGIDNLPRHAQAYEIAGIGPSIRRYVTADEKTEG